MSPSARSKSSFSQSRISHQFSISKRNFPTTQMASLQHISTFAKICKISRSTCCRPLPCVANVNVVPSRTLHHSPRPPKDPSTNPASSSKPDHHAENPPPPSFNLLQQIREARPAVRYTVYAGLGLMTTVETTFWFNVLRAKFFPRASGEKQRDDDELLERMGDAVKGYRRVWMGNYGRYYGADVWGLGYGGLDGLDGLEE